MESEPTPKERRIVPTRSILLGELVDSEHIPKVGIPVPTKTRPLAHKQLDEWELSKPEFVEGNLCDPTQVLSSEQLRARDVALNSLANARARDLSQMRTTVVD